MIEVTAKLVRGYVFLTGEVIECNITFSSPPSLTHKISQSHNDIFESLAWASVQLHCQCFTDPKIAKSDDQKHTIGTENNTALSTYSQDAGKTVITTKPKILFCDLRLSPGQAKTCE